MRREGGLLLAALALAAAAWGQPLSALAVTPVQPSAARAYSAPRPQALATVDHPPVDGVSSFDNGPRTGSEVALTFDADMTAGMLQQLRSGAVKSWYNAGVRQVLEENQVPATLFLTGLWAQAYPDVARDLAHDPLFEIGSHTYDHAAFRTPCYGLAQAGDRPGEITQAAAQIQAVTGVAPRLLRFPGDCYDRSDVQLAAGLGYRVISGDVRGGDAFNLSAVSIAATVLGALKPGSIVLLHMHGGPNAPMTAQALRLIIPAIRQRGLGFTTVSSLLGREAQARAPAATPKAGVELLAVLRAPRLRPPSWKDRLGRFRTLRLRFRDRLLAL